MITQTRSVQQDLVKNLRKIREQISNEIKDMTFEEERAYLDELLADRSKSVLNKKPGKTRAGRKNK
jgi:ribosomal protein S17E